MQIFRYIYTLLEAFLAPCVSDFYYIYPLEASDTAPNPPPAPDYNKQKCCRQCQKFLEGNFVHRLVLKWKKKIFKNEYGEEKMKYKEVILCFL